jgi:hypothetical protein
VSLVSKPNRTAFLAGLIAFATHSLLVLGVMYLDLTAKSREVITLWVHFLTLDFPASKIVQLLDPAYGVPIAIAFGVVGGFQWFLIVFVLVWFRKK